MLIAVAVLALGCVAIWMTTRASDHDSHLASVLVEEIVGTGPGVLLAGSGVRGLPDDEPRDPKSDLPVIEHTAIDTLTEEGMPF